MTTNGLLLVDKPGGMTSHDVVVRVRRLLGERRVGHAGTLDPMATGLLILGVGPSTRLLRFAQGGLKRYTGTVRLGVATDSLDADGEITEERPVPVMDPAAMNDLAASMLGDQRQVPPMVSALKVGGVRLHELARQGVEVEREARAITISTFALTPGSGENEWDFEVECTPGTYVRVLLSDLAGRAGTVGHLVALRRVASGRHVVADALDFDEIERRGSGALRPPAEFVGDLAHVTLDEVDEAHVRQGRQVSFDVSGADEVAALKRDGSLIGVLTRRGARWQPELVLPAETPAVSG